MTILLLLGLGATSAALGDGDFLRPGIDRLKVAIEQLGTPAAGEVESELDELQDILASLERKSTTLAVLRDRVDSEQRSLDQLHREREAGQVQLDLEQRTLEQDEADYKQRVDVHNADAMQQHAAAAAATTPEQVASVTAWASVIEERRTALQEEGARGMERSAALESRRAEISQGIVAQMVRGKRLQRFRAEVDAEVAEALGRCSSALSRALALLQIVSSPARTVEYEPPDALAKQVVGDIFTGVAMEGALIGLEGKTMVKLLAKVGLPAQPVGLAYTAGDAFADVAIAGVDQRTKEVTKNLFLIGDYGAVMKKVIQAQGPAAVHNAEYVAMRAELERLAALMPATSAQMLLQGLTNSAAFGTALTAAAGSYVSATVGHASSKVTNHLNNAQRAILGKGGVKFFRNAMEALGAVSGDQAVELGAQGIADATRMVSEERAKKPGDAKE